MTKRNMKQKKAADKMVMMEQCMKAVTAYKEGGFQSMRKCSKFYNISNSTLRNLVKKDSQYQGSGKKLSCLTQQEEAAIVTHLKWRASIGCGMDWRQLQSLIQEVLIGVKEANPERITGYENTGQVPNITFVRRLADRHNLTLRKASEISKGVNIYFLSSSITFIFQAARFSPQLICSYGSKKRRTFFLETPSSGRL